MKSIACLLFLLSIQVGIASENNCQDKKTNDYWDDLAIDHADSISVTNLVKLRKQLCRQIGTGEISAIDAKKTFDRERAWVVVDGKELGTF